MTHQGTGRRLTTCAHSFIFIGGTVADRSLISRKGNTMKYDAAMAALADHAVDVSTLGSASPGDTGENPARRAGKPALGNQPKVRNG